MKLARRLRSWVSDERLKRRFAHAYRRARTTAKPGPYPLVIVLDHPKPDGSPAHAVRVADAFGARAVYVIGTKYFYPPRSLQDVPVRFFDDFASVHTELAGEAYEILALHHVPSGTPNFLHATALPRKTAFVVGNERTGLSFEPSAFAGVRTVTIAQYGAIPWLNAGLVVGMATYEYSRQHGGRHQS